MSNQARQDGFEPEFRFSDHTILEADGEYEMALELMRDYGEPFPWCLITDVTIVMPPPFGVAQMTLELYSDGQCKIVACRPSSADALVNFDIRCLRAWTDANGWKPPEPSRYVIEEMPAFWKHMWQVGLITSQYMMDRYGIDDAYADDDEPSSDSSEEKPNE